MFGIVYLSACTVLFADQALERRRLPGPRILEVLSDLPFGFGAYGVLAGAAVLLGLVALGTRAMTRLQWFLGGLVGLWLVAPVPSLWAHQEPAQPQILAIAATGVGVVISASLLGAVLARWVVFVFGVLWVWVNLALGSVAWVTGSARLSSVLELDPSNDRYTAWVQALGLPVDDGAIQALVALSTHRQTLGAGLALLLVLQVRHLLTVEVRKPLLVGLALLGPASTAVALLWTFSRTSIAAALVGILASLLPIERLSRRAGVTATVVTVFAIPLVPLALRGRILDWTGGTGTLGWRAAVWEAHLANPDLLKPFGIGSAAQPRRAIHAHNDALQALVTGGWLGALALTSLVAVAAWTAVRVAGMDRRATFACLITAAVVTTFEVIVPVIGSLTLKPALLLVIVVIPASAELIGGSDRSGAAVEPESEGSLSRVGIAPR